MSNSNPKACILSVTGPRLNTDEALFLAQANPWGIILMGRSIETREQVRALIDEIWAALGRACLVFVDQEGGRVRRLRPPEWPDFPAAGIYSALYRQSHELGLEASFLGHRLMAHELETVGFHANCSPVLDLLHAGAHDIIGDRSFGNTPDMVVSLARAAIEGLHAGGVASVVKHMPGHGRAKVDSHKSLPAVSASREELEQDFAPFAALNDAPMGMTAHIAYEALDKTTPATLSSRVIRDVIRGEIAFDGLLMTDDLGMNALGGNLETRAKSALEAGCDIILHCAGFEKGDEILAQMRRVAGACPSLDGVSLRRAQAAEEASLDKSDFDVEAGWVRFNNLLERAQGAIA